MSASPGSQPPVLQPSTQFLYRGHRRPGTVPVPDATDTGRVGTAPGAYCSACGSAVSGGDDDARLPFSTEETIAAVLVSMFIPGIALVVALVLRASEARALRRQVLRIWAIASAAWLCTGWLLGILAIGLASSRGR
jgi:hypothetical protein